MQSRFFVFGLGVLGLVLPACASDDGVQGDRIASALEANELNITELGFNEDSCADEAADVTLTDSGSTSDGAYDHPGCPHQFIVTKPVPKTQGLVVLATYMGGIGGEFICQGSWTQVAIWKRPTSIKNAAWTRVGQSPMILGADGPAMDGARAPCRATALVHLPDDTKPAEYRVVAQAGWTTTFQPVLVSFLSQ